MIEDKLKESLIFSYIENPVDLLLPVKNQFEIFTRNAIQSITKEIPADRGICIKLDEHNSEYDYKKNATAGLGLPVSEFGNFDGSFNFTFVDKVATNKKTFRVDLSVVKTRYSIIPSGEFLDSPKKYLTQSFKDIVRKTSSMDELYNKIGAFYPSKIHIGGIAKQCFYLEEKGNNITTSIAAELSAEYRVNWVNQLVLGALGVTDTAILVPGGGGSAKTGLRFISKQSGKDMILSMATLANVKGGDEQLFYQALRPENIKEQLQNIDDVVALDARRAINFDHWLESVEEENMAIVGIELKPIFRLVRHADEDKSYRFAEYVKQKVWRYYDDTVTVNHVSSARKAHKIKDLIRETLKWNINQRSVAEGQLYRCQWSGYDHARNENWKQAANDNIDYLNDIRSRIESSADEHQSILTVHEFDRELQQQLRDFQAKATMPGYNFEQHNKTYEYNLRQLSIIKSLLKKC